MKKVILFLLAIFIANTVFAQLNVTSRNRQPEKVMSIRPGYSQLYYDVVAVKHIVRRLVKRCE
jgi:hypothetical protein